MNYTLEQIKKHLIAVSLESHKGRVDNSLTDEQKEILKQISQATESLSLQIEQLL